MTDAPPTPKIAIGQPLGDDLVTAYVDMRHLVIDRDDQVMPGLDADATAVFSPCRSYRYALTRRWSDGPRAVFIMLNPSTADAFVLDPTVRRCIGFAKTWGAGALLVLNAFALRSTKPTALYGHDDPIGPDNDQVITAELSREPAHSITVAWGVHGAYRNRGEQVAALIRGLGLTPGCLGTTKDGHPKHPLYVPGATRTSTFWNARRVGAA